MKLTSLSDLRRLLAEYGVRPSRALGQNFLIDTNILRIIVETAELQPADRVLEVGAGAGILTEPLLDRVASVTAVEKDHRLCALLRARLAGRANLELIESDALDCDLQGILDRGVRKVVSNLPYSAGTRILIELVHARCPPDRLVVTLQTDVAARLMAPPGGSAYGLLAVWAQRLYEIELRKRIAPGCFYPAPEVQSALVVLRRRDTPLAEVRSLAGFVALTRQAFMHRRKMMQKILQGIGPDCGRLPGDPASALRSLGLDPAARPENLGVTDWARLANALHRAARGEEREH